MPTPYQWPLAKLDVVNSALAMSGDNLVVTADDGSDEWNAASPAYERGLAYAIESHSWGFASKVVILQPSPTVPPDVEWDTAFPLPADLVHLLWVRLAAITQTGTLLDQPNPTVYDIQVVGGVPCIVVNAQGGPPQPPPGTVTPSQCTIKYVSQTYGDISVSNSPTLVIALQSFTMSGIYRGLHEDTGEANNLWKAGELYLQQARTRYDQQKPKRAMINSRITAARRVRRPWPPIGIGSWSGTNVPG